MVVNVVVNVVANVVVNVVVNVGMRELQAATPQHAGRPPHPRRLARSRVNAP